MKNCRLLCMLFYILVLMCLSCKKGPGLGGQAKIRGRINGILYNKTFTVKLDSGAVSNWTVNIIYGDDVAIDANQKTSYDGVFEFSYLRRGHYKIFTYSRAHKTNLQDSALVFDVEVTGKKQVIDLPDMHILR